MNAPSGRRAPWILAALAAATLAAAASAAGPLGAGWTFVVDGAAFREGADGSGALHTSGTPWPRTDESVRTLELSSPEGTVRLVLRPPVPVPSTHGTAGNPVSFRRTERGKEDSHVFLDRRTGETLEVHLSRR